MGDRIRFEAFADLVESHFPDRDLSIVDVAAGKGKLKASLYQKGYTRVTAWDRRQKYARQRPGYHYGYFDFRSAPGSYDLILGMHPDQATDHIILYASQHRRPFVVCPCCVMPSAAHFEGDGYEEWMCHLMSLAYSGGMAVNLDGLPMRGRNLVLIGRPRVPRTAGHEVQRHG